MNRPFETVRVDAAGRILLPPGIAARLGITPGAVVRVREDDSGARMGRSSAGLARLYVEPTTQCNLSCAACIRSSWKEPVGRMSAQTWQRLLGGLAGSGPAPSIFLGGYGEPLCHPGLLEMIGRARSLGIEVELITNGTLLDARVSRSLVDLGVARVWISIDESSEKSHAAVRRGSSLSAVTENAARLLAERRRAQSEKPRIGVSFVAMRDTIGSLPAVLRLGRRFGADRFLVSNLLVHTPGMAGQALYQRSQYEPDLPPSEHTPLLELPRMELNDVTEKPLADAIKDSLGVSVAGQPLSMGSCTCPFVDRGSMAVRWDGAVSPCLPLLHGHVSWLGGRERRVDAFAVGDLATRSAGEIWTDPAYQALREKLIAFDFAPCTTCNGCEEAAANKADCFGNGPPACGGCLWAQGFIRCP